VLSKQVKITCVLFFPFVCCFGLLWRLVMRSHFQPFTGVLREIWRGVTRKVRKTADCADVTDWGCRGSRLGCLCLMQAARLPLQSLLKRDRLLSFVQDFFKTRIAAQGIPNWERFLFDMVKQPG
jgi:hypothetical protein